MPELHEDWRPERPAEGFHTRFLAKDPNRPVRMFLPTDYQPRYAYPLVVLLHGNGGNEEQVSRLAPQISRRNYITISLRGTPAQTGRLDGRPACNWDVNEAIEEYFLAAIEETQRAYHVHAERVYLIGVKDGAAAAYRLGFGLADRIGGIVALNGRLPESIDFTRMSRPLPVLLGHGSDDPLITTTQAKQDHSRLRAAGAEARFLTYPTTNALHPNMLRDVNRWIIGRVNRDTNKKLRAN